MPIPRSQSTPHVTGSAPFLSSNNVRPHRPKLPRHRSAIALADSTPPTASSGRYTPLSQGADDPFSLTGFFSPGLSVTDESSSTWNWLRSDMDERPVDTDLRFMASGCVSPISEEDADLLAGTSPSLIFDKSKDKRAGETIREEDKLGILALPTALTSEDTSAYDHLLSHYSESDPEDDNALYEALLALRQAHVPLDEAKNDTEIDVRQGLFSPVDHVVEDEYHAGHGWESLLCNGLGMVLDIVAV